MVWSRSALHKYICATENQRGNETKTVSANEISKMISRKAKHDKYDVHGQISFQVSRGKWEQEKTNACCIQIRVVTSADATDCEYSNSTPSAVPLFSLDHHVKKDEDEATRESILDINGVLSTWNYCSDVTLRRTNERVILCVTGGWLNILFLKIWKYENASIQKSCTFTGVRKTYWAGCCVWYLWWGKMFFVFLRILQGCISRVQSPRRPCGAGKSRKNRKEDDIRRQGLQKWESIFYMDERERFSIFNFQFSIFKIQK
jgi:hypothetical protein